LFYNGTKFVAISEEGYTSTYSDSDSAIISAVIPDKALDDLTDVNLTNLTDGQYITYDSATQKWVNTTASVTTSLSGLTDVALSSLVDGQVLSYNSNTQKWVNGNALKNTATGTDSLSILGNANARNEGINIGASSSSWSSSVVIGKSALSQASNTVAIGNSSLAQASGSVALGQGAKAKSTNAIQIGAGMNSTANTLSIGLGNNNNYQLLDATGVIPDARISNNIARSADLTTIVMRDWSVA
jgi:autotransporter adhesin